MRPDLLRAVPADELVQRFRGPDTSAVFAQVRAALGDDAVVLGTTVRREARPAERVEIAAASAAAIERLRTRLTPAPLVAIARDRARGERPLVLAVVGPSGAGKTTVVEALAAGAGAFDGWSVGLVTLDARRPGALERLHARASAARLPLEVVYEAAEVAGAMRRLKRCDVVLVDTPPRGRSAEDDARCDAILAALAPDEVHLVAPAALRLDLAPLVRAQCDAARPTHTLLAKLDELPGGSGAPELAAAFALPVRWVSDAGEATQLATGVPRLLAALGASAPGAVPYTLAVTRGARATPPASAMTEAAPARPVPAVASAASGGDGARRPRRIGILASRLLLHS